MADVELEIGLKVSLSSVANVATIAASILVILAVAPALKNQWLRSPARGAKSEPIEHVGNLKTPLPKGSTKGSSHARVAVIEFADFQCPFCGSYARETFPTLEKEYINIGKVVYAYRNFPLTEIHPFARDAGKAALCAADQQKFWPMHDRLFADQHALSLPDILSTADKLGLDRQRLEKCLMAPALVLDEDIAEAKRLGVTSTPTFLVGTVLPDGNVRVTSKINGARGIGVFRSAVAEAQSITPG